MKSIIMLSGPVGAGKTTVAQALVACSPGPMAYIEGDTFWSFIAKGGPGAGRQKNFRTIMTAMTAAAVPFALSGYEVLLDFSIPPWFIDTALKVVRSRDVPLDYVVLRPGEALCASRAAARADGRITDYSPYHDLYLSFDEAGRFEISDGTDDATTIAASIREGIDKGKFRAGEN